MQDWHANNTKCVTYGGGNNHIVTCAPNKVKFTTWGIHDFAM
jgi:hypothetical protein